MHPDVVLVRLVAFRLVAVVVQDAYDLPAYQVHPNVDLVQVLQAAITLTRLVARVAFLVAIVSFAGCLPDLVGDGAVVSPRRPAAGQIAQAVNPALMTGVY